MSKTKTYIYVPVAYLDVELGEDAASSAQNHVKKEQPAWMTQSTVDGVNTNFLPTSQVYMTPCKVAVIQYVANHEPVSQLLLPSIYPYTHYAISCHLVLLTNFNLSEETSVATIALQFLIDNSILCT